MDIVLVVQSLSWAWLFAGLECRMPGSSVLHYLPEFAPLSWWCCLTNWELELEGYAYMKVWRNLVSGKQKQGSMAGMWQHFGREVGEGVRYVTRGQILWGFIGHCKDFMFEEQWKAIRKAKYYGLIFFSSPTLILTTVQTVGCKWTRVETVSVLAVSST